MTVVAAVLLAACGAECRYDPAAAKRTFDGRVGHLVIENRNSNSLTIRLYHPDGDGGVELVEEARPGRTDLGAGFGNDWGIALGDGCPATIGEIARWDEPQFIVQSPPR